MDRCQPLHEAKRYSSHHRNHRHQLGDDTVLVYSFDLLSRNTTRALLNSNSAFA
jgi:hypothetical protein